MIKNLGSFKKQDKSIFEWLFQFILKIEILIIKINENLGEIHTILIIQDFFLALILHSGSTNGHT
jgi:hypothetical protein